MIKCLDEEGAHMHEYQPEEFGQSGWMLLEVMIVTMLMGIVTVVAMPRLARMYAEAATEYTAQCLLSDIRYAQTISRTGVHPMPVYNDSDIYSGGYLIIEISPGYYRVRMGAFNYLVNHKLLPFTHVTWVRSSGEDPYSEVYFTKNGELVSSPVTFHIYNDASPRRGWRLMISSGSRVRLER